MAEGLAADPRGLVSVVAVVYAEPEWAQTRECLEAAGLGVTYVDRQGVGSLAEALNRGFREAPRREFTWFVTNVVFYAMLPERLASLMSITGHAAIHPRFESDHEFMRRGEGLVPAPFVEFTAPMVRSAVFARFPLDEAMPYWGHDLDWGARVRAAGHTLAVDHGCEVAHIYSRHMPDHPATRRRRRLRRRTNAATTQALVAKYGPGWREVLWSLD